MKSKAFFLHYLIGVLILVLAVPPAALPQGSVTSAEFSQEQLDQMLAPIALYPDALLAQLLVAATYPEQIAEADQWVKENSGLEGDRLNDALDRMEWDLSVKALVPFPKVLDMMSDKREWTQELGEAFLAQETDVMDTIQKLRSKAHAQGNLKSTEQQRVVVKGQSIEIEPVNPRVVYVPAYNPVSVYGPWWHSAYPPYGYSPYYPAYTYDPRYVVPGFIAAGALGFAAAVAVGGFWHHGWGHWDWGRRNMVVNVNRNVNINRTVVRHTTIKTTNIKTAVRQGKIGSPATRTAVQKRTTGRKPTAVSGEKGPKQREGQPRAGERRSVRENKQTGVSEGKKTGAREGKKAAVREGRGQGREMHGGRALHQEKRAPAGAERKAVRGQKDDSRGKKAPARSPGKAQ